MDLVQMLLNGKEFKREVEGRAKIAFLKIFGAYHPNMRAFSGFMDFEGRANRKTSKFSLEAVADRLVEHGLAKRESHLQQAREVIERLQFKHDDVFYRFVVTSDAKTGKETYCLEGKDVTPDYGI